MRLLYDGRIFDFQRVGGINRYFCEVISRLPPDWIVEMAGVSNVGPSLPQHANFELVPGVQFRPRRFAGPIRKMYWEKWYYPKASVIHPTYYDFVDGVELKRIRRPIVLTVHDMIFATYPGLFPGSEKTIRDQREATKRADHIVCVSHATENDLLSRIPEACGKTSVIHLASSLSYIPSGNLSPSATESKSFIYVGTRSAYKNFSFLLRALARAKRAEPTLKLKVVGGPLSIDEQWEIKLLGLTEAIEVVLYPDEESLRHLYAESLALLYPSTHEGFGIPPLEAMSCGTLAVTSDRTSLPEVVGDAGIMLDPTDEDQWCECMVAIHRGTMDRGAYIQRGVERAKAFAWDTTARLHVDIYRKFAG